MINHILVAVDLTETEDPVPPEALDRAHVVRCEEVPGGCERLLSEALALACRLGASLEIAYVRQRRTHGTLDAPVNPDVDEVDDWIDRELMKLGQKAASAGVSCTTTSLQGPVRRSLVSHVRKLNPDLIVLGSHRRWHGFTRCAEHALVHAHQRVLVIPATGPGA